MTGRNALNADFFKRHFEEFLVIGIIATAGFIHYFVEYKLVFLNIYFLPVLVTGYYLGIRKSLFVGLACILMTILNVWVAPEKFAIPQNTFELGLHIFIWGSFLLLTAITVDGLKRRLVRETERTQKLNQEISLLTEFDKIKDRFLHSVSHDLKAPLNAIEAYSQLLMKGLSGPMSDQQLRQVGIIHSGAEQLTHLVDDILDLAKWRAGRMQLEKSSASVSEIVRPVFELQKANADRFRIRLESQIDDDLPSLKADRNQMGRVLTNLIFNAFKFTPDGGTVRVSATRKSDGALELRVSDTGIGIPEDKLETIFSEFTQVLDTRKKARIVGTGLGLAITKEIVEAHGGKIWAESVSGKGSTFRILLPV